MIKRSGAPFAGLSVVAVGLAANVFEQLDSPSLPGELSSLLFQRNQLYSPKF